MAEMSSNSNQEQPEVTKLTKLFMRRKLYGKYDLFNEKGEELYNISKNSSSRASLQFSVKDKNEQDVLELYRPFKIFSYKNKTAVRCQGVLLGHVLKHFEWTTTKMKYIITNEVDQLIFIINSPNLTDLTYKVFASDRKTILGTIVNRIEGHRQFFEICFPTQLNINMKSLILASCIMIIDDIEMKRQVAQINRQVGQLNRQAEMLHRNVGQLSHNLSFLRDLFD